MHSTTNPKRRRLVRHRNRNLLSRRRALLTATRARTRRCAPGRGGDGVSCFTMNELREIASLWNRRADTTPATRLNLRALSTKSALWNAIDQKMRETTTCTEERCWVSSASSLGQHVAGGGPMGGGKGDSRRFLAALDHHAFRPRMPTQWRKNKNEWLSTTDIERVLQQYQQNNPRFRFVGAVPIDFASPSDSGAMGRCVTQALCNVRLSRWLREGVRYVGIVFNLDRHTEPGSHWVSAYMDLSGNGLYYYDSFGGPPPQEINQLFTSIGTQLEAHHGIPATIQHNPYRHQFRNTECGVYSIFFLSSMLDAVEKRVGGAEAFARFVGEGLNDGQVERYREVYYDGGRGESLGEV